MEALFLLGRTVRHRMLPPPLQENLGSTTTTVTLFRRGKAEAMLLLYKITIIVHRSRETKQTAACQNTT